MQFEIEMVLERYPTDDSSLSDNIGILWAMPRSDSTPAENKWEVGVFMQGSIEGSSEKTQVVFPYEGLLSSLAVDQVIAQTWILEQAGGQTATYNFDANNAGAITSFTDSITEPHWNLSTADSYITANKWTLSFSRTDSETLNLKRGSSSDMVCYMAVMDNFTLEAVDQGVEL